jgi:hypothetical protein
VKYKKMKWTGLQVDSYVWILCISCYFKVKPITDEFDKTFEWKSVYEIPDHKVILEEALIVLRQKIGLSF